MQFVHIRNEQVRNKMMCAHVRVHAGGPKQGYSCECTRPRVSLLSCVNYCVASHTDNCKPAFPHPCVYVTETPKTPRSEMSVSAQVSAC